MDGIGNMLKYKAINTKQESNKLQEETICNMTCRRANITMKLRKSV
jgi:hypothetical protein